MRGSVVVARLRAAGCVFAEEEARLLVAEAQTPADLVAMVDRRVRGVPLEHVLGWTEFCGLRIETDAGVFVPRRRTEFLVQQSVAVAGAAVGADRPRGATSSRATVVVDLCCGSGAVGVAVTTALADRPSRVELHAVDVDPAAVRCARRNVAAVGGRVYAGDLDAPLPRTLVGRVDLLVANVPYVPSAEVGLLPREAREHEPRAALDGGDDGLDLVRGMAAAAPSWLAPGGHVLVETSEAQQQAAVDAFTRGGLRVQVARSDEHEATVVVGTAARSAAP